MAVGLTPGMSVEVLDEEILADRRALRQALLERRRAMPRDQWMRHSTRICELLQVGFPQLTAMRVGFCWPLHQEPDLRPLIDDWLQEGRAGFNALLPVVIDTQQALAFRAWSPDTAMVRRPAWHSGARSGRFPVAAGAADPGEWLRCRRLPHRLRRRLLRPYAGFAVPAPAGHRGRFRNRPAGLDSPRAA
jgi:hypothetical protein